MCQPQLKFEGTVGGPLMSYQYIVEMVRTLELMVATSANIIRQLTPFPLTIFSV